MIPVDGSDGTGAWVLAADARAVEEELACLRDKLSEMIIVGGRALACSPDVKKAYQSVEVELDRVKQVMLLGCQDSESMCPFWQNWHDSDEENKRLTAELATFKQEESLEVMKWRDSSEHFERQWKHRGDLLRTVEEELAAVNASRDRWIEQYNFDCEKIASLTAEVKGLREAYNELVMEVAEKYPNETRHETARRYLRERGAIHDCNSKQAIAGEVTP